MATSYQFTRDGIHEAMATERWQADQAAREQPELDVLSVYLVAKAKMEAGDVEAARAIVAEYRAQKASK